MFMVDKEEHEIIMKLLPQSRGLEKDINRSLRLRHALRERKEKIIKDLTVSKRHFFRTRISYSERVHHYQDLTNREIKVFHWIKAKMHLFLSDLPHDYLIKLEKHSHSETILIPMLKECIVECEKAIQNCNHEKSRFHDNPTEDIEAYLERFISNNNHICD